MGKKLNEHAFELARRLLGHKQACETGLDQAQSRLTVSFAQPAAHPVACCLSTASAFVTLSQLDLMPQELFEDPVVCADGHTYSRAAIAQWLQSGRSTSPITNLRLSSRELRPNYTLRSTAMEWQEAGQSRQK